MKHCHNCRIERHLHLFQAKKVGVLGVVLFGAHLLFHIVELLVLPSLLVAFGGHLAEEPAAAVSEPASDSHVASVATQDSLIWSPCRTVDSFRIYTVSVNSLEAAENYEGAVHESSSCNLLTLQK